MTHLKFARSGHVKREQSHLTEPKIQRKQLQGRAKQRWKYAKTREKSLEMYEEEGDRRTEKNYPHYFGGSGGLRMLKRYSNVEQRVNRKQVKLKTKAILKARHDKRFD